MSDFDPVAYLRKTYRPGEFITSGSVLFVAAGEAFEHSIRMSEMLKQGVVHIVRPEGSSPGYRLSPGAPAMDFQINQLESGGFLVSIPVPSAPRAYAFSVVADEMEYAAEARRRFYDQPGQDEVGDPIRKITALRAELHRTDLRVTGAT